MKKSMEFRVKEEDRNKTGVYKITNILNGDYYIGSTSVCFRKRFTSHLWAFKNISNWGHLYRAMNKCGIENFVFEVLLVCPKDEVVLHEQKFIDNGSPYNSRKIADSCLGVIHIPEAKTRNRGESHHASQAITQYTLDGIKVRDYGSLREALRILNKTNNSATGLTQCCKGILFSLYGYRWSYKDKPLVLTKRKISFENKYAVTKGGFYKEFLTKNLLFDFLVSEGFTKNLKHLEYRLYKKDLNDFCGYNLSILR